jgi:hypothetical protein
MKESQADTEVSDMHVPMMVIIFSADSVSAEHVRPASLGRHFGEDGDLSELFQRNKQHT